MTIAIIIVAVLVILVLWGISIQRNLVGADEKCSNSLSQIGVQQNSRWDAIGALADLVRSYNEHEYRTLSEVIAQRQKISGRSSSEEANRQEALLGSALGQINVLAEQYPELKANENYGKMMSSLNDYENNVRISRMVYNDCVTKYNRMVRQFPDSFIASMLKFSVREYLEEPQGKTEMPKINI